MVSIHLTIELCIFKEDQDLLKESIRQLFYNLAKAIADAGKPPPTQAELTAAGAAQQRNVAPTFVLRRR